MEQQFVELDKTKHERTTFHCGQSELDLFLKTQALKHMQAGVSKTMVLPSHCLPNQKLAIKAFYTITPGSIARDTLPATLARKLPHYPIPVFLLAQLAVDKQFHCTGLGKISLIRALHYLWLVNQHMRAYAVVVDCLTDSAQTFYTKFGFAPLCQHQGRTRLSLPMKTIEMLFR
ncbi:MAG: GNAT family N-acetyltransferase [Enterovibrio sp.]